MRIRNFLAAGLACLGVLLMAPAALAMPTDDVNIFNELVAPEMIADFEAVPAVDATADHAVLAADRVPMTRSPGADEIVRHPLDFATLRDDAPRAAQYLSGRSPVPI